MRPTDRSLYNRKKVEEKPVRPLIFGRFDGETVSVSSKHQLALAIRSHWDHVARLLKRKELPDFLQQFDADLAQTVRGISLSHDTDVATFKLLYALENDGTIFYRGKDYGMLDDFLALVDSAVTSDIIDFVMSGLFTHYLRSCDANSDLVDALEHIIQKDGLNNMATIRTLCYSLKKNKELELDGRPIVTLDDFVLAIAHKTTREISDLLDNSDVIAWLYSIGFQQDILKMSAL